LDFILIKLWRHLGQGVWLWAVAVAMLATVCARIGMRPPGAPAPAPAEPVSELVG